MNKILFYCYNGKELPSSRVRCYHFAKILQENNLNTEVVSCKDDLRAEYDGPESNKMSNWQRIKVLIRATKRLLKENKNTIFYVQKTGFHVFAPVLLHKIKGNKIILDYDDYEYDEQNKLSTFFFKTAVKNAEFCVAASKQLEELLKKFHEKVYYIPTGADLNEFQMRKTQNKKNTAQKNKNIKIYWGGIIGSDEMLETLKKLVSGFANTTQKSTLQIGSSGERLEKLKEFCKQQNITNTSFLPWLSRQELLKKLDEMDIGLMPLFQNNAYNNSKSPTKLFEYLAKGMITISSSVGEMNHIINEGENGFLAKDEHEFIQKLEYATKNYDKLEKMRNNARETAEKYSIQALCKELYDIVTQPSLQTTNP